MEINTIEIGGFRSALISVHLPFSGEPNSDTEFKLYRDGQYIKYSSCANISDRDLKLLSTLVKRGDEHAKVLRGINVYAEITTNRGLWQELDTYSIGRTPMASSSTMHTITKRYVTLDDFNVSEEIKECLTPSKPKSNEYQLHFDKPEELKCVILNKYGRDYEVWNDGRIFALEFESCDKMKDGSIRKRVFPKTQLSLGRTRSNSGYFQVGIGGRNGKIEMVHRIIAEAFCPNPNNYPIVNHKDGDKGNCSPSNLEWCTHSQNNKHAFDTGLKSVGLRQRYLSFKNSKKYTEEDICAWFIMKDSGCTYEEISERTGVSIGVIESKLLNNGRCSEYSQLFENAYSLEVSIDRINSLIDLYKEFHDESIFLDIKALLPESFLQRRIQCFNYQCLRHIYFQRRNHRLPEWHQFCEWIESLPFAKELITIE